MKCLAFCILRAFDLGDFDVVGGALDFEERSRMKFMPLKFVETDGLPRMRSRLECKRLPRMLPWPHRSNDAQ